MLKRKIVKQASPPSNAPKAKTNSDPPEPTKPKPTRPAEEEEEEETEGAGVGAGKKRGSWAGAFDSVPLSNNAEVSPGVYEAIVRKVLLQPQDERGQSVRFNCELCSPEFEGKNSIAIWFQILDKDGEPKEGGIKALRFTLARLGYEPSADELEEAFEEINEEQPGILLEAYHNQGYTNYRVKDVCDNDVVEAYKDNIPY